MGKLSDFAQNRAIDIKEIFASNSKLVMEKQLVRELERFCNIDVVLTELQKRQTIYWVMRFIKFHNQQHPISLVKTDIESFLSSLSTENHYSFEIQQVAENALKFLYTKFFKVDLGSLSYIKSDQRRGYLSYFGKSRCDKVLHGMSGVSLLMAKVMLLGNVRLSEVVRIKKSDIDIKHNQIKLYREKDGSTERELLYTIRIPLSLVLDIRIQLMRIERLFKYSSQSSLLFQTSNPRSNTSEDIKKKFKDDLLVALNKVEHRKAKLHISANSKRFNELRGFISRTSDNYVIDKNHPQKNRSFQYELEVA
ncbi:MAG: phage integrase N-terminal SAM-like domain-containing protein [Kangiellaceae bacterium]